MSKKKKHKRPKTLTSFLRAQVSSLLSTGLDFTSTFFVKEILGLWYVIAVAIGALVGTMVNFTIGRYWVFVSRESHIAKQASKYLLVSAGSLVLNTLGVWLWVSWTNESWVYPAKIVVGLFVGFTWNFMLQKKFVYK